MPVYIFKLVYLLSINVQEQWMEALPFRRPVIQYKYNKGAQEQTTFAASQKCKLFLLHYMYIFYLIFVSLLAWGNHLF